MSNFVSKIFYWLEKNIKIVTSLSTLLLFEVQTLKYKLWSKKQITYIWLSTIEKGWGLSFKKIFWNGRSNEEDNLCEHKLQYISSYPLVSGYGFIKMFLLLS